MGCSQSYVRLPKYLGFGAAASVVDGGGDADDDGAVGVVGVASLSNCWSVAAVVMVSVASFGNFSAAATAAAGEVVVMMMVGGLSDFGFADFSGFWSSALSSSRVRSIVMAGCLLPDGGGDGESGRARVSSAGLIYPEVTVLTAVFCMVGARSFDAAMTANPGFGQISCC